MKSRKTRGLRSRKSPPPLFRCKLPLAAFALATFLGTSGFRILPDIDRANHKNLPTYNNAGLNSAAVTPTDFAPMPKLAQGLARQVPGVHYAVVLKRRDTLFAGLDTGATRARSQSVVEQASDWLLHQSPAATHVYVSADGTLMNHFHRYAADRAAHLGISSDIILSDIRREFPGVK